jgi:hypothetical protein
MILTGKPATVNVHTDKKIKRNRRAEGEGACVSLITEPEDTIYRISFFKRRRLDDKTSVRSDINEGTVTSLPHSGDEASSSLLVVKASRCQIM